MANLQYNAEEKRYEEPPPQRPPEQRTTPPSLFGVPESVQTQASENTGRPSISNIPKPGEISYDPSRNINAGYIGELEALGGTIPSLFGGGGGKPKVLDAPEVTDEGFSQGFQDFSKAFADKQLASLDPSANPFGQQGLNIETGNIDRQFKQQMDALTQKAENEGWLNTPKFDKAVQDMGFANSLATQTNRVAYKKTHAEWDFKNREVVDNYYKSFTDEETKNRQFKLQTGKINADFAWNAAKYNAKAAQAAVAQRRASASKAYSLTRQNIFDRAGLEGQGAQFQVNLDKYNLEMGQADNWAKYNAGWNEYSFEEGIKAGDREGKNNLLSNIFGLAGTAAGLLFPPAAPAIAAATGIATAATRK